MSEYETTDSEVERLRREVATWRGLWFVLFMFALVFLAALGAEEIFQILSKIVHYVSGLT